MQKYFNILLEFNRQVFNSNIENAILNKYKGYVCVVDGNVLAHSTENSSYRDIINGSIVNSCDGSSIAILAGLIYKQKFSTYTGPEILSRYINRPFKQYFLGNTEENLARLKIRFNKLGYPSENYEYESLPFNNVEEFHYEAIAMKINEFSPDIIWVSLGAPKQETFIHKLYPYLNGEIGRAHV